MYPFQSNILEVLEIIDDQMMAKDQELESIDSGVDPLIVDLLLPSTFEHFETVVGLVDKSIEQECCFEHTHSWMDLDSLERPGNGKFFFCWKIF